MFFHTIVVSGNANSNFNYQQIAKRSDMKDELEEQRFVASSNKHSIEACIVSDINQQ